MKLVLRGIAYLTGLGLFTTFIVVLNDLFPWAWLPLLMGFAVSMVVWLQAWIKPTRLGTLLCSSITLGTTLTYCISSVAVHVRLGLQASNTFLWIVGLIFSFALTGFLLRGLHSKNLAAMTLWLLVPIGAGCILGYVSGGIGAADHMRVWLTSLFHLAQDQTEAIIHWLRKTIHFVAYGFLGYCIFRAAMSGRASRRKSISFALLMVLCMASFDELRQTTAPNRTGSAWDVALDMTGATTFVILGALTVSSASRKPSVA